MASVSTGQKNTRNERGEVNSNRRTNESLDSSASQVFWKRIFVKLTTFVGHNVINLQKCFN